MNFRKRLLKIEFQKVNFKNSFQKPSETLLKQIIYFRTGITQVHTMYLQSHRYNVRGPQKKIFYWLHFSLYRVTFANFYFLNYIVHIVHFRGIGFYWGSIFCYCYKNPSEMLYVNNEILKKRNLQNHPLLTACISAVTYY